MFTAKDDTEETYLTVVCSCEKVRGNGNAMAG